MQFYTAVAAPIGESGLGTAESFFKSYLAIFVVALFWVIGYLWKREGWQTVDKIDVDTGRRELDYEEIRRYREEVANYPTWRRILNVLF